MNSSSKHEVRGCLERLHLQLESFTGGVSARASVVEQVHAFSSTEGQLNSFVVQPVSAVQQGLSIAVHMAYVCVCVCVITSMSVLFPNCDLKVCIRVQMRVCVYLSVCVINSLSVRVSLFILDCFEVSEQSSFHIDKLESILRKLQNDETDPSAASAASFERCEEE